jgi:hypothetical protein
MAGDDVLHDYSHISHDISDCHSFTRSGKLIIEKLSKIVEVLYD